MNDEPMQCHLPPTWQPEINPCAGQLTWQIHTHAVIAVANERYRNDRLTLTQLLNEAMRVGLLIGRRDGYQGFFVDPEDRYECMRQEVYYQKAIDLFAEVCESVPMFYDDLCCNGLIANCHHTAIANQCLEWSWVRMGSYGVIQVRCTKACHLGSNHESNGHAWNVTLTPFADHGMVDPS